MLHRVSETKNVSCKLKTFPFLQFWLSNCCFWKLIKFKDNRKENTTSNKTQALTKVWIWTFGKLFFNQINYWLIRFLTLKLNFQKNKVITGKTEFFVTGLFRVLFVLTFAFDKAVLHGNIVLSIEVLSSNKRYPSFSRKPFIFQKTCFSIEYVQNNRWQPHKKIPIS